MYIYSVIKKQRQMKEYKVNRNDLSTIRAMFHGYIFRRVEDGQGYVKCTDKYAQIIKGAGIDLKEIK